MIAAKIETEKENQSQLHIKTTEALTRLLPPVEHFVENFVQEQLEEAQIDAAFQLCVDPQFLDAKYTKIEDNHSEENKETIFYKIRSQLLDFELFITKYMWIIALFWLVFNSCHWFSGLKIWSASGLFVKPAAPPTPFFSNFSRGIVEDHYFGNNANPEDLLRKSEVAILMYYAPWSLHSREARDLFTETALAFRSLPMVKFFAVNCFTKYGKCRKSFKLYSYPLIVGYVGKTQVTFNGPATSIAIFRFVRHLLKPIEKVTSYNEFDNFLRFNHLVVGFFPFSSTQSFQEYTTFLAASLKIASNLYALDEMQFIVIQNSELANHLKLDWTNRIRIFQRNQKEWKPLETTFSMIKQTRSDDILEWIHSKINSSSVISWLELENSHAGGKSEQLQTALVSAPVALLFTTNFEGFAESDSFRNLKTLSFAYADCHQQFDGATNYKLVNGEEACFRASLDLNSVEPCCEMILKSGICKDTNVSVILDEGYCSTIFKVFEMPLVTQKCCKSRRKSPKQQFSVNWETKLECEWFNLQKRTSSLPSKSAVGQSVDATFNGFGCGSNETLKFMAADKKFAKYFIQNWNLLNESLLDDKSDSDVLTIISAEREAHYTLHNLSMSSMMTFIHEFHSNKLIKTKLTESENHPQKSEEADVIVIQKLVLTSFEQFLVANKQHDSVVFFGGGQIHGPSAVSMHVFHSVAAYFKEFSDQIKFYTIDTLRNELPYQYNFDRVPAISFFPANQNDSSVYPRDLPLTVPNVLAFILSRCQPVLRWKIGISTCTPKCVSKNRVQLKKYFANLERDLRRLRLFRLQTTSSSKERVIHLRTMIQRRMLQKRAAIHLDSVLQQIGYSTGLSLLKNEIIKQFLFIAKII